MPVAKPNPSSINITSRSATSSTTKSLPKKAIAPVAEKPSKTTKTVKPAKFDLLVSAEQVLAVPESDYMCPAHLQYFRDVLEKMRTDILVNASETSEHLRDNVVVPDPADRATIEEEHAIELRTRDRERKLLKKIAQALDAIEHGEYGWCNETGDPIGVRRLLARPTATLSLEAQARREMRQKMYGD